MSSSIFIIVFLFLLLIRVPVAISIGTSCVFYFVTNGVPFETIPQIMTGTFESFTLLAIPLFMLAGQVMNTGGVTTRLFLFAKHAVGHWPGGLAQVNVLASLIFAGMSGSATADAAGLGTIEIDYMKKEGYDPSFAAAITSASSAVGTIMPPSLGFVIYGALTGASIGGLFLAGILPAFLITGFLMLAVYFVSRKKNFKVYPKATLKMVAKGFAGSFFPLLTPIIILLGITTGVVTPTEAAVIAVLYAIFLGFIYKELDYKSLIETLIQVGKGTSKIMFMVALARVFGWILTYEGVPENLAQILVGITANKYIILFIIMAFLLFLGCFMESISVMLITLPVLYPILIDLGISLIHFGVVLELVLNIGLITPPLGVCAYLTADIAQVSFSSVIKSIVPFLVILILALLVIAYIPGLSLFLPRLFGLSA